MKTKTTQYDLIAKQFKDADTNVIAQDITRRLLYQMLPNIRGSRVLDLGCSYGGDIGNLHKKGATVYGIDESREEVNLARQSYPDTQIKKADMASLPYFDSMFDVVYSRYTIQHAKNLEPVFKEINRVLRPGGNLVFLVTHPFRQFFEKPIEKKGMRADYFTQRDCVSSILEGQVTVSEPSHAMQEYLSAANLYRFEITDFREAYDPHADYSKKIGVGNYPDIMLMRMTKPRAD